MIRMDKIMILDFLKSHKNELKEKFNVEKIGLFGSYVRDEANENSDIDIVVKMPSDFKKFFELQYYLEKQFNKKIDLGLEKTLRSFIKDKSEIIYV